MNHGPCQALIQQQDEMLATKDELIAIQQQQIDHAERLIALQCSIHKNDVELIEAYRQMVGLLLLVVAMGR